MSRSARTTLPFGPSKQQFCLDIPRLEELQEIANKGPEAILRDIQSGDWKAQDVRDTLRLGLIGGGMSPPKAAVMVERYAGPGYLAECKAPAVLVLMAALVGAPESQTEAGGTPKGEAEGVGENPPTPED